ncbi:hypothetical protein HYFRA_00009096 [Hymenoscyphus fraxineus]|uniref:Uncharacterized protein n=1 Tax=Hymenoscyphus fraxineus TaxID=746836 RepID=A0A9N9KYV5_9HELO|nr:hypothetical protein HYFRA_00009096 [Hymenoscyphus fraxineus]
MGDPSIGTPSTNVPGRKGGEGCQSSGCLQPVNASSKFRAIWFAWVGGRLIPQIIYSRSCPSFLFAPACGEVVPHALLIDQANSVNSGEYKLTIKRHFRFVSQFSLSRQTHIVILLIFVHRNPGKPRMAIFDEKLLPPQKQKQVCKEKGTGRAIWFHICFFGRNFGFETFHSFQSTGTGDGKTGFVHPSRVNLGMTGDSRRLRLG